jgi:hypothetical protein
VIVLIHETRFICLEMLGENRVLRWLMGSKPASTFRAVLVDPFAQDIRAVVLPSYPVDAEGEVVDEEVFRRALAQRNRHIGDDIIPGNTSFRDDCHATIDAEGLLRTDAAYWRLEVGPEERRDMRDGRYLIYGSDGMPAECDVPPDREVVFWRRHVRWVEAAEARAWCRALGIDSPYW